jgi:hypothetical protein
MTTLPGLQREEGRRKSTLEPRQEQRRGSGAGGVGTEELKGWLNDVSWVILLGGLFANVVTGNEPPKLGTT